MSLSPTKAFLLALLAAATSACRSTHGQLQLAASGIQIAQAEDDQGTRMSYELYPGRDGPPRIDRTESFATIVPRVGLDVSAVTRERATAARVEPWKGVWIDAVGRNSPAYNAGLRPGEIVVRAGGVDVTSPDQFTDLIRTNAVPGEPYELGVLVQESPESATAPRSVQVVPIGVEVRQSSTESFELSSSMGVQRYTGLQVAELSHELTSEVYGLEGTAVVVSGVVSGTPAYESGLRRGDRVLQCDGWPVEGLQDVRDAVRARLADRAWPSDDGSSSIRPEPREGPVELMVEGPLGYHQAKLSHRGDLNKESHIHIPILLEHRKSLSSTRTSFLDFILQFGFNYTKELHPSATREPVETSKLSILPFGMFEVEKGVDSRRYRILWFINFGVSP